MINNKMKILDLFAGTQSVKKAFPKADYKGIDIAGEGNLTLDLSSKDALHNLIKLIGKWKPDFIWASPPCESFSRATSIKGGTLGFEVENEEIKLRKNWDAITHKSYAHLRNDPGFRKKHRQKAKQALAMLFNALSIVKHYNVPYIIEQPASAISKYILKPNHESNLSHYCAFGYPYQKATVLYAKYPLALNKCTHKAHKQVLSGWKSKDGKEQATTSAKLRAKVPPALIKQAVWQLSAYLSQNR